MTDQSIYTQIKIFLDEDVGTGDLTAAIIPDTLVARADVTAREDLVVCGQDWFTAVFHHLDPAIVVEWLVDEGQELSRGALLCIVQGKAKHLLTGERTALNLLQTLSATATIARQYAKAVAGTQCKVLDTRKTIPGLRRAQKYAVKCGGCENHRIGLFDGILIKENHIISAGSIATAVARARQIAPVMVEVEVENLDELRQAIDAAPDRIMLDNFSLSALQEAVQLNAGRIELEASGNIELTNIRQIAETGVNYISIGALTKHVRAVDLSMRIITEAAV
jgi:nicotinate-nucleotide pyrophosphorylase (carboxylating)